MAAERNEGTQAELKSWEKLCAELTDEALLTLFADSSELSPDAQAVVKSEVGRRRAEPLQQLLDPEDFVTLLRFADLQDQALTKGVLDSAGIGCFEFGYTIRNSRLILQVQRKDVLAACEVLSQPTPEMFTVEGVGEFSQPRCPSCSSLEVSSDVIEAASELMSTPGQQGWKCNDCQHRWQDTDDQS